MRRGGAGALSGGAKCGDCSGRQACFAELGPGGCRCAACVSASAKRKSRETRPASSARWGTCGRFVVVFSGGRRNSPEGAVRSFGGGKEKWKRASAWRSSGAGGRGAELRGWVGKFVRRGAKEGVPDAASFGASAWGGLSAAKESAKESERRSQAPHRLSDREKQRRRMFEALQGALLRKIVCLARGGHGIAPGKVSSLGQRVLHPAPALENTRNFGGTAGRKKNARRE